MPFYFTPEEAQATALAVEQFLTNDGWEVQIEAAAWPDVPFRTTLIATKAKFTILIEAQGNLNYHQDIRALASHLAARRINTKLYLAANSNAAISIATMADLDRDGVGLFRVDDNGNISEVKAALNAALIVTPDPNLRYGTCHTEVHNCIDKYNRVDRKSGLRDLCELVERETQILAIKAFRRGHFIIDIPRIEAMDWSRQISALGSQAQYNAPHQALISPDLHADLQSFRTARNLVDHKAMGKRAEANREKQFPERMMQGARLIAELKTLQRRLR